MNTCSDPACHCQPSSWTQPPSGAAEGAGVALDPSQALKTAVEAATAALDAAKADGLTIPPQAAAGVAVLDTTSMMLAQQIRLRA